MQDNIDTTEWLPRNAPVVNPYRLQHGDLQGRVEDGRITYAEVADTSVLADLIRRGFLEEYHREAAMSFLELRNAFFGPLQHRLNATVLEQITGLPVNRVTARDALDEIMLGLKLFRARIIEHACNVSAGEDAACQTIAGINAYQDCFEMLLKLSDDVWTSIRKEMEEKACERSPFPA